MAPEQMHFFVSEVGVVDADEKRTRFPIALH